MALNKTDLGKKISDALQAANPNTANMTAPEKAEMQAKWEIVADEMIKYFKTNMDINLSAGDIPVPSTGLISASPGSPVTGSALNGPTLIAGRIQ